MPKTQFLGHFHIYTLRGYVEKIFFHTLGVPDMFETSPNDYRKSFLSILEAFRDILSDIDIIFKKVQ